MSERIASYVDKKQLRGMKQRGGLSRLVEVAEQTYAGTEGWVLVFSKEVFYGTAAPIADAAGLKLDGCPEFAKEVQL
jgi:hypothetical protein